MKILIAPDSFKHCLPAYDVAVAIEKGIRRVLPSARCINLPMADGGDGTVAAILHARGGKRVRIKAAGPLSGRVRAGYCILNNGKTAVIEMAAASGLMLLTPGRRNPSLAGTYGTGELLADAVARGAKEIIIGLGGSATVDGGAGMAQALGVRFRDLHGKVIRKRMNGGMLQQIATIDAGNLNPAISRIKVTAAADVNNRLCGRYGAAKVFGPQKGATAAMVKKLENNLRHFAGVIKRDLQIDVLNINGGGAAGGLAAGLVAFTGSRITSGVELVAGLVDFDRQARGADLIMTGEGRIDAQTRRGKVVSGVAAMGRRLGIPVVAIGGSVTDDALKLYDSGIAAVASTVTRDMDLAESILHAPELIANAAEQVMRLILLGKKIN